MQIRTVTRTDVTEYWTQSRVRGTDLGEVLDRAGVLLTPERLAAIRASLLNQMAQVLDETPTHQYTRGRGLTLPDFQALLADAFRHEAATEMERVKK